MKKSKTKKLDFKKLNVVELNDNKLHQINGGSDVDTTRTEELPTRITITMASLGANLAMN